MNRIIPLILTAIVALLVLCPLSYAKNDWTFAGVGNDEVLKGRASFGDPEAGLAGVYASWRDTGSAWGGGVFGQMDISGTIAEGADKLLGIPDGWWDLLDKAQVRTYVGVEVGPVYAGSQWQATTTPYAGVRLGPLCAEVGYQVFEGGRLRDEAAILDRSGMTWFLGVSRVFRF